MLYTVYLWVTMVIQRWTHHYSQFSFNVFFFFLLECFLWCFYKINVWRAKLWWLFQTKKMKRWTENSAAATKLPKCFQQPSCVAAVTATQLYNQVLCALSLFVFLWADQLLFKVPLCLLVRSVCLSYQHCLLSALSRVLLFWPSDGQIKLPEARSLCWKRDHY